MARILTCLSLFLFLIQLINAQNVTYPSNGVDDFRQGYYALTNADVQVSPEKLIEDATLVLKEGRIESVKSGKDVPNGAIEIDMEGMTLYPAFVEIYGDYGSPEIKSSDKGWNDPQVFSSTKKGAYGWNEAIMPEFNTFEEFETSKKDAESLRKSGFGTVVSHRKDGIARGTGVAVLTSDQTEQEVTLKDKAAAFFSFDPGKMTNMRYPSSLMGAIALIRQTYYDAEWYENGGKDIEFNISLQRFNDLKALPAIFEAEDLLDIFRIAKIGEEFGVDYIVKGDGSEYRRVEDIKNTGHRLIIPLTFPDAYAVKDPWDAELVSLDEMKHWELAPYNASMLAENDIEFAITASDNKSGSEFMENLRKAVEMGLSKEEALAALTTTPASWIGLDQEVGKLEKGYRANILVMDGELFDEDSKIYQTWVNGHQYEYEKTPDATAEGIYLLTVGEEQWRMKIKGDAGKEKIKIKIDDSTKVKIDFERDGDLITMQFATPEDDSIGVYRLSGSYDMSTATMSGSAQNPYGKWLDWNAYGVKSDGSDWEDLNKDESGDDGSETEGDTEKKSDNSNPGHPDKIHPGNPGHPGTDSPPGNPGNPHPGNPGHPGTDSHPGHPGPVIYPFTAYGWTEESKPEVEDVLIRNVTVWTNEEAGIMENASVYISGGKIKKVSENLFIDGVEIIDGTGKHLTSGIIDEHSHIAISRGVNEGTEASSAEVRIRDVINSEDVNIYRQLAGGTVAAQLLHGSANPIGGQSGIVKFRWGQLPEEMKIEDAPGFIKFALGENVKQSNWGDNNTTRFPQTRMGVEQTYYNYFTKAREYQKGIQTSSGKNYSGVPVRKDLELDALSEILNEERFITCHSYVQSEINMLMHVCDSFGFQMNTFTHILEGYKVADKMKENGVFASTFSDWWAYKYEVIDAIPYNAAILSKMGIVTAINSDDAEMGRRLNQEAAKGVKYGGMSQEEAWKMVTLNPAKMLHLDDRMGSVKEGKDADIVLWSDNPLSVYAKAEKTWVDGVRYWDIDRHEETLEWMAEERNRLIQKMIAAEDSGAPTQRARKRERHTYGCADLGQHASGEHQH